MMIDLIKGKTREEAQILIKTFLKMITRENENNYVNIKRTNKCSLFLFVKSELSYYVNCGGS